jgi:drug/metabolite transporter (DMT)-like permease
MLAVGAAFAFALSFVLSKYVYDRSNFVTGFIWGRVGTCIAALMLLAHAEVRRSLRHTLTHFMSPKGALFFGNQFLGAAAIVLQSYATSLGNVAVVQSLQGVQFAAVFLIAVVASIFMPKFLKEFTRPRILLEKAFAILLVSAGVAMLALL